MADEWRYSNVSAFPGRGRPRPQADRRVLIYSHDTFGLGHLRRSRAIANTLADYQAGLSVIIVSGSPIVLSFAVLAASFAEIVEAAVSDMGVSSWTNEN